MGGRYLDAVGGPWVKVVQERLWDISHDDVRELAVGVRTHLLVPVQSGAVNTGSDAERGHGGHRCVCVGFL